MELRSNRSRSRSHTSIEKELFGGNNIGQTVIRTTRSTTVKTTTLSSDNDKITNINHNLESHSVNPVKMKNENSSRKTRYKTSDYSSEDGDNHVSSSDTHDQNSKNQFLENMRRSVSRCSGRSNVSALDVYRAAGDYWNKFPKTDYTYSPHSKDRTEIAPGVMAMPNMSRRSLHSYNSAMDYNTADVQSKSESYEHEDYSSNSAYSSKVTTNFDSEYLTRARPRNLFLNNNSGDKYSYSSSSRTSSVTKQSIITRVFITIFSYISSLAYYVYKSQNSVVIWMGKKLHQATTRVMIWDTWLLQATTVKRKMLSLLALCLIPLVLLGGWWLLSGLGPLLSGTSFNMDGIITPIWENPTKQEDNNIKLAIISEESEKQSYDDIWKPQQLIIDNLKEEIYKVRFDLKQLEKNQNEEIAKIVAQLRSESAHNSAQLTHLLKRCCRHSLIHMEGYITRILKDLLGAPHYLSTPKDISNWLHSTFIAKQDLEMHLANLTQHLKSDYDPLIKSTENIIMDKVVLKISEELNKRLDSIQINMQNQKHTYEPKIEALTDEYIKKIVQDAIALYDADKTGLVDYALESAGGHILSTRCTESYHGNTAVLSIFGIPLWYPTMTPRTVITPGTMPGECWAFQKFPGYLLIKLAAPVKIEAFSVEHISKMLTTTGKIDSAPKEFSVYGLRNESDREPIQLGEYVYDYNGPPLQYFASEVHSMVFEIIELRINSNHGNPNYTCLYRFRVHGKLSTEPT